MADIVIKNKFLTFLRSKSVGVISTVSSSNQPMSATIYFSVDKDLNFYFMTKSFTRKYQNLLHNNQVALLVGTENIPTIAQIQGTAEKIVNKEEFALHFKELKDILSSNEFVGPLFEIVKNAEGEQNEIYLFKIIPSWIRWLDLREGVDHNDFIQILP